MSDDTSKKRTQDRTRITTSVGHPRAEGRWGL